MEPPRFTGEDASNWIHKIQRYFNHSYTPESDRLYLVTFLFDPPAFDWAMHWKENNTKKGWDDFLIAVKHRFDPNLYDDYIGNNTTIEPPDPPAFPSDTHWWGLPPSLTQPPTGVMPMALPRPRFDAPRFDGENVIEWIRNIQRYYNHCYTPLSDRLYLTKYLFDQPASDWMTCWKYNHDGEGWDDFLLAVYHRFAPKKSEDEVSHVVDDDQLVDQPPIMESTNNIISNGIGFDTINCYEYSETITEEVFASAFFEEAGSCVFDQVNLGIPYIVENSKTATSEPVYVGAYCILDSSIVLDEKMARQNMEEYRKFAYASSIPPNLEDLMVYKTMEAGCNKRFHENDYGKDDAAAALGKQHFELLCITLEDTRERSDGVAGHNISYNLTEAFAADTHSFLPCDDTLHLGRNITIGLKVPPDRTSCSSSAANASVVDSLLSRISTAVTNKQPLLRVTSAAFAAPNKRKSHKSAVNSTGYARKSRSGHEVSLSCPGRDPRAFWRHSDIDVTWPMSSTLSTASTRWGRELLQFGEKKGVCVFDPGDFESTSTLRRSHSCSYWSDSHGFRRKLALKGVDALVREVASTKDGSEWAYFLFSYSFQIESADLSIAVLTGVMVRHYALSDGVLENVVDHYPETIVDDKAAIRYVADVDTTVEFLQIQGCVHWFHCFHMDFSLHRVAATSRKFEGVVFNIVDVVGQDSPHKLQMIQAPTTKNTSLEENASGTPSVEPDPTLNLASASAEEGLAVQIALEMARSDARQSAAEEANVAARCKLCVLLKIRASEYGVIKLIFCYIVVIYALRTRRFLGGGVDRGLALPMLFNRSSPHQTHGIQAN